MQHWHTALDQITREASSLFGGLSETALNWNPAPDRWSIAQNLEHLIVLNESYYPIPEQIRANTYKRSWLARFGFVPQLMGSMLLKAVAPGSQKSKTFPIWQPSQSSISSNIVEQFSRHQERLKAFMADNQDLVQQQVIIASPANKNIVYTLGSAFDIIVAHEQRHLQQAKSVLAAMKEQVPAQVTGL